MITQIHSLPDYESLTPGQIHAALSESARGYRFNVCSVYCSLQSRRQRADDLDLKCQHTRIADAAYDVWINQEGKSRFILTLLSRAVTAEQFAAVSQLVADQGLNIDVITRLSGRPKRIQRIHPSA